MDNVILFDGECSFCDWSVQFIVARDRVGRFSFASLQSEVGQKLLREYGLPATIDSFVLIERGKCYVRSTAALRVSRYLRFPWSFFAVLLVVPAPVRDIFYTIVAKNRYKWFGKKEHCLLPTPEQRKRFLS